MGTLGTGGDRRGPAGTGGDRGGPGGTGGDPRGPAGTVGDPGDRRGRRRPSQHRRPLASAPQVRTVAIWGSGGGGQVVVVVPCGGGMPYGSGGGLCLKHPTHLPVDALRTCPSTHCTPARRHRTIPTLHTPGPIPTLRTRCDPFPRPALGARCDPYPPHPVRSLPPHSVRSLISALGAIPTLCALGSISPLRSWCASNIQGIETVTCEQPTRS